VKAPRPIPEAVRATQARASNPMSSAFVSANAGSGKTHVLVQRVIRLLLDGVPPGRKAAEAAALAPSPTALGGLTADDVSPVAGIDFSKATVATVTLNGGNVVTISGTTVGDKHWVSLQASKDAALNTLAAGRAFELAGYRFDAILRPLEQLLVPKEPPPGAHKADSLKPSPPGRPAPPKKPLASPAP